MIEFFKYVRGYLRIRVSGFSPERFMNLCSNKGILLWKIVREGDVYYMNINLKGFRALRPIVRKTGTRVAILERYGLPFFLPKLLKRKVFVGGLLFAVAFWMWSSLFIWDIELSGNYRITDDMFQSFLKENEVIVGMKKGELDIENLEKEIRRSFSEVTWASARLSGTRLLIDIKENDAPVITQQEKTKVGSNLVSSSGGTVVSIIVRSGVPMVAAGDTIEAGTVLVEGRVPVYNDDTTVREYIYVDADADIILEHTREFSERLPLDYIKKEYTGREKTTHYLRLGNNQMKLPQDRPFLVYDSVIRESRPLIFEKLSIPVYMGSCTYREYMDVEYKYSREEAEEQLSEKLITFLASLEEKGVQIIEKDVKIESGDNFWVLSGLFLVQEPVGDSVAVEKIIIGETEADE
ncbi:MAG: sporulation protein YqfD [Firmicutes bacterium]|nr:sporulation protein YqfD [Bacillota bacterium]